MWEIVWNVDYDMLLRSDFIGFHLFIMILIDKLKQ